MSNEPPERSFEWGDPYDHHAVDATLVPNAERFSGGDAFLGKNLVAFVPEGGDELVEEMGVGEVEIPRYYSRFEDEFDPCVIWVTASSGQYGYGITPRRLEGAIRVATGGGRFSRDGLTVVAIAETGILVRAPDGDFLVSATKVGKPDGYTPPGRMVHDVSGMEIPETSATIRDGIESLITDVLPTYTDREIVAHEKLYRGKHYFRMAGGGRLRVNAGSLRRLGQMTTDGESLFGEHEYTDPWDETFTFSVDPDDLEYDVGDEYASGPVVGYRLSWRDPRRTSRASLSGRVSLDVSYGYLTFGQVGSRDGEYRVTIRSFERSVGSVRPENKEYDPIGDM